MADIILFTPKADVDAEGNLSGFIETCKQYLAIFGRDLPFDENVWNLTGYIEKKGKNHRIRAVFSNWDTVNGAPFAPMEEPFRSFAKAYVRYQHGFRPTLAFEQRIGALRALQKALDELGHGANPIKVNGTVLDRAAHLISQKFAPSTAYRMGGQLEMIAEFMAANRLMAVPIQWKNPILRGYDNTIRIGKEFEEKRAEMMPSRAALESIPKAFRLATESSDVIVTSILALLCSSPDRINEVLLLPLDCEVNQKRQEKNEQAYGLRWWPAKGAEPMIKWIIPTMCDVVRQSVHRLREQTEQARQIARWYENNPGLIYLPPELEHFRDKAFVTHTELGMLLYGHPDLAKNDARGWCAVNKIEGKVVEKGGPLLIRFSDVERSVLRMLPDGFPFVNKAVNLRYSEALVVVKRNQLNTSKSTYQCMIEPFSQGALYMRLGNRKDMESIFDKFGFYEEDGSRITLHSHQLRHYLNTLAQSGGMSQLDIALWSGRKDVRQNAAYDHVSGKEVVERIRASVGDGKAIFGALATITKAVPISRDDFAKMKFTTAHTTEFGFCLHDYSMSPCQLHLDCINCGDLLCIKGDQIRNAALHRQRGEVKELLVQAESALKDDYDGADRWVEHHRITLAKLDELCDFVDNPKIPAGAMIQLAPKPTVSRVQVSGRSRIAEVDNCGSACSSQERACLPNAITES